MAKTGIVNWEEVDSPRTGSSSTGQNDRPKPTFLRLKANEQYVIRPLAKPMEVWKYFTQLNGGTRSAIVEDAEQCPVAKSHPDLEAKQKFAINVIDRSDGELKVLEAPPSVFWGMRDWAKMTKKKPGGSDVGGDFCISVQLPPGKNRMQTKYSIQFIEPTPLTDEEKKMAMEDPGLWDLEKVYKPHTPEEIERLLFGTVTDNPESSSDGESKADDDVFENENKAQVQSEPEAEPKTEAVVAKDEDLAW
tara:strand:- start:8683 stop:9426 length:744 start_codon:yes stop_codon:yes gene_type:complete